MATTIERVTQIITDNTTGGRPGPDQALFYDGHMGSDQHLADGGFGLDSLDRVEVVMAIEEEFQVEVPDSAAEGHEFNTVKAIAAWVDEQTGEG